MHGAESTHPNIVALVDPLFACGGKRVRRWFLNNSIIHSLTH